MFVATTSIAAAERARHTLNRHLLLSFSCFRTNVCVPHNCSSTVVVQVNDTLCVVEVGRIEMAQNVPLCATKPTSYGIVLEDPRLHKLTCALIRFCSSSIIRKPYCV